MYNIQKAVSRLPFAPKLEEIKLTDIKKGLGKFVPKADKSVSFAALKSELKKAGYTLDSAEIIVRGTLRKDGALWWLEAGDTKQRFAVEGDDLGRLAPAVAEGSQVEVTGGWQTVGKGDTSREVIRPRAAIKVAAAPPAVTDGGAPFTPVHGPSDAEEIGAATETAPIRTTSPGLTVYRGGAFTPRYLYTRQSLGGLNVDRHAVRLDFSYTPTPALQLEAEVPFMGSSFASAGRSGSDSGFGNLILWGKYRFFRTLETWGDRQASIRLGFELPSGKKSAPGEDALDAPEYVRQQLGPIQGGAALHTDLAYSQARGRIIYGASVVAVARGERGGFRTGHELSVNTDFEYVLLPRNYQAPGRELFAILETTYSYRGRGRLDSREVRGSSASEFYLAPALQYAVAPRFVIEASYQFPVVRNTGPLTLRTDRNFLVGVRYLY